jgi:Type II secretion system protein C
MNDNPSNKKRPISRLVLIVCATGLGIWVALQLLPQLSSYLTRGAKDVEARKVEPLPGGDSAVQTVQQREGGEPSSLGVGGTDSSVAEKASVLMLLATSPGKSPREGTASLGTDPHNPQVFVAGAMLANGAELVEIYDNRVVLQKNGATATLHIAGPEFRKTLATPAEQIDQATRVRLVTGPSQLVSVGGALSDRQPLSEGRNARSGFIRVERQAADGIVQGFRLSPGAEAAMFSRLGFQNGDVMTAVDGSPVDEEADVARFVASVGKGDQRAVTVVRGGNSLDLLVDGSAIRQSESDPADHAIPPSILN